MSNPFPDISSTALEPLVTEGLERVEALLEESVRDASTLVDEILSHLAQAGGKRLRPLLCLVCSFLGTDQLKEEVVKAGAVCELTHLASLYHDDVMDAAPARRGVPSAQMVWGNNRAILAGDVLFARASLLTVELGLESTRHHSRTFERLCFGQLHETFGPSDSDDPVDFYLQVLADKTGSLVATAAFYGALHGGAGTEIAHCVEAFGEKIGVAFQLADDVIDLTSPAEVSGKTPGTDLREGVDTMPILLLRKRALEGTLDEPGQRILGLLGGDLSSDENLAEVVNLLAHHEVVEETRALARQWVQDGLDLLEPLPEGDVKRSLQDFAHLMVERAS